MAESTTVSRHCDEDDLGLLRKHEDESVIDALWRVMNMASDPETGESTRERERIWEHNRNRPRRRHIPMPSGIVEGSPAWNDAQAAGVVLTAIEAEGETDLFANAEPKRYQVDIEDLYRARDYGGEHPLGPDGERILNETQDTYRPYAWDEERVLVSCPRGMCMIGRRRWNNGYRSCPGC